MSDIIPPWDLATGRPRKFDALAARIVGQVLSAVYYEPVPGGGWPDGHRHDTVHEVDMAVRLSLASGESLVARWEMQGLNEGLGIGFFADAPDGESNHAEYIDVSSTPQWRPLLGASIKGVVGAYHVPNEGCPEMLWAIRVAFSDGRSAVIALGEMSDDILDYLPDGLVAIFDEAEARGFKIESSAQSAWGDPL